MRSDVDALDFVEGDLLLQAVVELGGPGGLVAGDARGDLEVAAVSQVLGYSGAAEAVSADFAGEAGAGGAALDHLQRGGSGHRFGEKGVVSPGWAGTE